MSTGEKDTFIDKIIVAVCDVWSYASGYVIAISILLLLTFILCCLILKYFEKPIVVLWSNKVHTGYGNLLFAVISILWASSVSVFGTDLKKQWFTNSLVSWESLIFSITVCFAIIVGFFHYIGQQRKDRERQSRPSLKAVQRTADDIIDLTNALHTCLLDWESILINRSEISTDEIKNFESKLKNAKKECLTSLLHIATEWDDSNDEGVIYKANVLNIASSLSVIKTFEKGDIVGPSQNHGGYSFNINAVETSPFFLFNDNWRSKLERTDFIMVNEQTLSVSIPTDDHNTSHSPICMPFSENGETSSNSVKQPNLHGAPMARKKKRSVYLPELLKQVNDTISKLEVSPKHKDYVNDKFKQDLLNYYENDPAGSIISIPIHRYKIGNPFSDEGSTEKPIKDAERIACILNVYATKNYLFANDEMANAYSDLTKPICYIFSILVSLRFGLVELNVLNANVGYPKDTKTSKQGDNDGQ